MKVFAILAATAFAVVSAQVPECDLVKLREIIAGPNGKTCQTNSGFSPLAALTGAGFPTGDVLKKACTDAACKSFLGEMTAAIPTECLAVGIPVKSTLLDKFAPACAQFADAGPTTAPAPGATTVAPTTAPAPGATTVAPTTAPTTAPDATTAAPDATTAAPDATTTAPDATTAAPEEDAEGSTSSGSTDIDTVEEPVEPETTTMAPGTPTPAPTTSGAATVVATVSAVVVAVAAAFL